MKPILIIDPGHGGNDPGGGSNNYWIEKDMNLTISLYQLNRYKQLGVPVAITRKSDSTLTSSERTKIVRESGATYCHSNHINSGGGDGAEVIHSIYGGEGMAEKIAEELRKSGQNVRRIFTRTLPNDSQQDYYYMNRETGSVVTNIIEYGFADSRKDDVRQINQSWRSYAEAVVKAFCEFTGYAYEESGEKDEPVEEKPPTTQKQYLQLPKDVSSWRVYKLNVAPVVGNEKGFLNPMKFGGLTYEVLGNPQAYVYVIQTRDFGMVQIYAHPNTGATISGEEIPAAINTKSVHLPASATSWRVYPLNVAPVVGNEKGFLRPAKFDGLTYEILGSPQAYVYIIQTRDFGKVQLYAHPDTGAKVSSS